MPYPQTDSPNFQAHQVFNSLPYGSFSGRVVSTKDIDSTLDLVERLARRIREFFSTHSRLDDPTDQHAASAILTLILCAKPLSKKALMDKYSLSPDKVTFLIDYTTFMIRLCLMDMKDELTDCHFLSDFSWGGRIYHDFIDIFAPEMID